MCEQPTAQAATIYVDVDGALTRIRGNQKLFKRMLTLFLKNTDFASFEAAYEANDIEKAEVAIHTLKGVTGNLSLTALFTLCNDLLGQLRNGAVDAAAVAQLRTVYTQTVAAVEALVPTLDA